MVENFLTVFLQVVILFCLIAFGFIGGKIKLINEEGSKVMSNIMIYFVTPCLIINSFSIEFDPKKLKGLLITFVSSFAIHLIAIILASLIFRGNNKNKISVLRFAAIFSNAGFMGIPLQEAVLGPDGVFYGSVYVAVFNIITTYPPFCNYQVNRRTKIYTLPTIRADWIRLYDAFGNSIKSTSHRTAFTPAPSSP